MKFPQDFTFRHRGEYSETGKTRKSAPGDVAGGVGGPLTVHHREQRFSGVWKGCWSSRPQDKHHVCSRSICGKSRRLRLAEVGECGKPGRQVGFFLLGFKQFFC